LTYQIGPSTRRAPSLPWEPLADFLIDLPGKWIDRAAQRRSLNNLILDLNNSVSETFGRRKRRG
jgi:hypothetical protein